ncbi:MAG TPA: RNA polymerase sigma factor [Solirubrobacterales bacterium]|jgi:RNA polymerase sigma factor (sigma-70 family)|nr:RNA polymerase sigma factor [Solirubrobacterales bacterium]
MPPPPAELFASRIFLGPALRAQPDRRLVGLVREGYDSAFEEIVRRYRRPLERFARAIVGAQSEDVTQDAFSRALLALRGSEAEIELRPWLYRIVRNTALNDLRDRAPAAEPVTEALPAGASAAAEAERREELSDLIARLRALPEPQRAAIVMRELEGLSHEEIAAALGVSGGAARQAIYRARAALRDGLGLLLPLPILRALVDYAGDAARGGGAIAAGAGASSAGGALGGLGAGGALKVGVATVLIAGTVGAGVMIDHQRGAGDGPTAASAQPPTTGAAHRGDVSVGGEATSPEEGSRHGRGQSDGDGERSGSGSDGHGGGGGSGVSGGDDARGVDGGGSGGDGPRTGTGDHSGSGSGDGSSGSSSRGGGGDLSGARSDDGSGGGGGSGGDGSSSGGSGSDDGGSLTGTTGDDGSGGSGSSGDGGGDLVTTTDPVTEVSSGESGPSSGSGSSGDGSGDLSSGDSSTLDGSP